MPYCRLYPVSYGKKNKQKTIFEGARTRLVHIMAQGKGTSIDGAFQALLVPTTDGTCTADWLQDSRALPISASVTRHDHGARCSSWQRQQLLLQTMAVLLILLYVHPSVTECSVKYRVRRVALKQQKKPKHGRSCFFAS